MNVINIINTVVPLMSLNLVAIQRRTVLPAAGVVQLINNTPKVTDPRVAQLLDREELTLYSSSAKPPDLCWAMLNSLVSNAGLSELQEEHVHRLLEAVGASLSRVNRIKGQAMPYGEQPLSFTIEKNWLDTLASTADDQHLSSCATSIQPLIVSRSASGRLTPKQSQTVWWSPSSAGHCPCLIGTSGVGTTSVLRAFIIGSAGSTPVKVNDATAWPAVAFCVLQACHCSAQATRK
jgi:hypothetical protein